MSLFESYPSDADHIPQYIAYQKKYADSIRESDRVILKLLEGCNGVVLDIGCSTGNLLRHIKNAQPALKLVGGDMSEAQLQVCREDPSLSGVAFEKMDIRALPERRFDVVIANAILYGFDDEGFKAALQSIGTSLRAGGRLIAFDFFHPFDQELAIVEKTPGFPNGHPLHFRSYGATAKSLRAAQFGEPQFDPFEIPISLPHPGYQSVQTYTVDTMDGKKVKYRGVLSQPWCHMVAYKK